MAAWREAYRDRLQGFVGPYGANSGWSGRTATFTTVPFPELWARQPARWFPPIQGVRPNVLPPELEDHRRAVRFARFLYLTQRLTDFPKAPREPKEPREGKEGKEGKAR